VRVVFCYPCFENLGIEYLSAVLKERGIETGLVFDPMLFDDPYLQLPGLARWFQRRGQLADDVLDRRPDLVAISVVAASFRWAVELAAEIKQRSGVQVVFGGIHASSAPRSVLEHDAVDYVIVGEGEEALAELAQALEDGADPSGIANLCFRSGGEVVCNPPRPLVRDLDALPHPDKDLFYREVPGFARSYTLLTRRGCVNRCSYCHNSVLCDLYPDDVGTVRMRSVDDVMEELTQARARWSFRRVRINDDLFCHDIDWLRRFSRRYREEIGVPFMCSCSPVGLTDEAVRLLKAAGCFQVCLGVQDVHESVRRRVFQRDTPQHSVVSALRSLRRHRLRATVDNIVGYDGQTEDDLLDVARFYLDNPVHGRFTVFWLIYYAGTRITEDARRSGLLDEGHLRELQRDPPAGANTRLTAERVSRRFRALHLLLILVQVLPRPVARRMLEREAHRWLPDVNPSVIEGLWTLFTPDRFDPVRQRYYVKYRQFGLRTLREGLRWRSRSGGRFSGRQGEQSPSEGEAGQDEHHRHLQR